VERRESGGLDRGPTWWRRGARRRDRRGWTQSDSRAPNRRSDDRGPHLHRESGRVGAACASHAATAADRTSATYADADTDADTDADADATSAYADADTNTDAHTDATRADTDTDAHAATCADAYAHAATRAYAHAATCADADADAHAHAATNADANADANAASNAGDRDAHGEGVRPGREVSGADVHRG
jgi:hypothetical protein